MREEAEPDDGMVVAPMPCYYDLRIYARNLLTDNPHRIPQARDLATFCAPSSHYCPKLNALDSTLGRLPPSEG